MARKKTGPIEQPEISFIEPPAPDEATIPEQKEHFALPVRFGAVPVDKAPLGWEVETRRHEKKFQHANPTIRLPFQKSSASSLDTTTNSQVRHSERSEESPPRAAETLRHFAAQGDKGEVNTC